MDYSRNWLFIDQSIQGKMQNVKLLIVGCGIGSQFAEVALRTGFRNMILADGDTVSESNLNRQNYTKSHLGQNKAVACYNRLKDIDPTAEITALNKYLTEEDLENLIPKVDFVINTIDFDASEFDKVNLICRKHGKTELFPINLGFGTGLAVLDQSTPGWSDFFGKDQSTGLKSAILKHLATTHKIESYLLESWQKYQEVSYPGYDPQLAISTGITAAVITTTLVKLIKNDLLLKFPNFIYVDAYQGSQVEGPIIETKAS